MTLNLIYNNIILIYCGLFIALVVCIVYRYRYSISKTIVLHQLRKNKVNIRFYDMEDISKECNRQSYDVVVHDPSVWFNIVKNPSLGFGEGYIERHLTTNNLELSLTKLLSVDEIRGKSMSRFSMKRLWKNCQSITNSWNNVKHHYDIGNDLYEAMLDKNIQYSCGWWPEGVTNLDEAQEYKMELICKKLDLRPGMRVLDIGCGWGGLMNYMQTKYKVYCDGLTLSPSQVKLGSKKFPSVNFILEDYRTYCRNNIGSYDRVVSVGMFEHVGYANYNTFLQCVRRVLKKNGILLLHTIGSNIYNPYGNDWIDKYIFPGGALPSISALSKAFEEENFVLEDLSSTGPYYARTLFEWRIKVNVFFLNNPGLYNERFMRIWNFYLTSSMVVFDLRKIQLYQFVLTPNGYTNHKGETITYNRIV
jgi:cyclopropane-fatty-acyl-phospholipid synthase